MPKLAPPGQNPTINASDVAASLAKAWTKACGERSADVRVHIELCRAQGDDAGVEAFVALGRDAWWVPLYADPSPATAAPILAAENEDETSDSYRYSFEPGFTLSRLLEVARLVPERREAALDRFGARAEALIEAADGGSIPFERLRIPYGWLARESLTRARALVDAHPRLLTLNGGLMRQPRWGTTSFMAAQLAADFDAALTYAPRVTDRDIYELPSVELYDLDLDAAQWVALARAATPDTAEHTLDGLLLSIADVLRRSSRPNAAALALAVHEAREEVSTSRLDLLIELGRLDEARASLATLPGHETDAEVLSAQRFVLGLDDLAEASARMARGFVKGREPKIERSRGSQLGGLLRLTELVSTHTPDDLEGLAMLEAERARLIGEGPQSQYDHGKWSSFLARDHLLRLQRLEPQTPDYTRQLGEVVQAIKSGSKDQRRWVASEAAGTLAKTDPVGAVKLAKIISPSSRCESAIGLCRAFLPRDPGGAMIALCSLCPKQPHLPHELIDGSAEVLRAIYSS